MARAKFQTLTEQMFYILLCMEEECCGMDVMEKVTKMTNGRVIIGAGTLYTLLADFQKSGFIVETAVVGRKRSYRITQKGIDLLENEYNRMRIQMADYEKWRVN